MSQYTIGLDFGTNSCRCIIIDINNGKEISSYVHNYKFGKNGVITNKKNPLVARQHPKHYTDSIIKGIKGSLTIKGIFIIYIATYFEWMNDTSKSLDRTMTTLDKYLNQASKILNYIAK